MIDAWFFMNKFKKLVLVFGALVGLVSMADASGPDLSAVTGGITDLTTAVTTAAATVIGAAIGLFAIVKGGVWLKRLWGKFAS